MARSRKSEAKRWFQQASYDLKASRWNIAGGFFDTASFLAQQGGEKALKSLLYYLGSRREALLTHSLVEMIRTIGKRVTGLPDLLEEGRKLDLHYVPSRYPNGLPSGYPHQFYGKEMAEEALQAAEKIITAVAQHYHAEREEDILREEDSE
jgi:HEPN domain-containing protein